MRTRVAPLMRARKYLCLSAQALVARRRLLTGGVGRVSVCNPFHFSRTAQQDERLGPRGRGQFHAAASTQGRRQPQRARAHRIAERARRAANVSSSSEQLSVGNARCCCPCGVISRRSWRDVPRLPVVKQPRAHAAEDRGHQRPASNLRVPPSTSARRAPRGGEQEHSGEHREDVFREHDRRSIAHRAVSDTPFIPGGHANASDDRLPNL